MINWPYLVCRCECFDYSIVQSIMKALDKQTPHWIYSYFKALEHYQLIGDGECGLRSFLEFSTVHRANEPFLDNNIVMFSSYSTVLNRFSFKLFSVTKFIQSYWVKHGKSKPRNQIYQGERHRVQNASYMLGAAVFRNIYFFFSIPFLRTAFHQQSICGCRIGKNVPNFESGNGKNSGISCRSR